MYENTAWFHNVRSHFCINYIALYSQHFVGLENPSPIWVACCMMLPIFVNSRLRLVEIKSVMHLCTAPCGRVILDIVFSFGYSKQIVYAFALAYLRQKIV